MGNRGARRRPSDTRGLWTPEKLQRAHQLFGKFILDAAAELQVPPLELMEYGLKGVIPPMGKGQRVAALLDAPISDAPEQLSHQ